MGEKLLFLYYDKNSKIIDKIDETNFLSLGKSDLGRIELYLYAMALGKHAGSLLSKKDSFVRGEYVERKLEAIPLITCLYLGSKEKLPLERITQDTEMYDYADECANTGFSIIENMINSMSLENLELNLISQLDDIFENNLVNYK